MPLLLKPANCTFKDVVVTTSGVIKRIDAVDEFLHVVDETLPEEKRNKIYFYTVKIEVENAEGYLSVNLFKISPNMVIGAKLSVTFRNGLFFDAKII